MATEAPLPPLSFAKGEQQQHTRQQMQQQMQQMQQQMRQEQEGQGRLWTPRDLQRQPQPQQQPSQPLKQQQQMDGSWPPKCTPEGEDMYQYAPAPDPGIACCEGMHTCNEQRPGGGTVVICRSAPCA